MTFAMRSSITLVSGPDVPRFLPSGSSHGWEPSRASSTTGAARHGLANEHNALVPRDWWLEDWEKKAILDYNAGHPLEGYHQLAFMMLDADVVAVSPASEQAQLRPAGMVPRPVNVTARVARPVRNGPDGGNDVTALLGRYPSVPCHGNGTVPFTRNERAGALSTRHTMRRNCNCASYTWCGRRSSMSWTRTATRSSPT